MQLVITHELSPDEYYWLYYLRNNLKAGAEIENITRHYAPNKHSKLYQAVMNVIIRGNWKEMEVDQNMCEALYELFKDDLKEREAKGAKGLIETCAEFGATRNETLKRLIDKLSLSKDSANEYMELYWK